VIARYALAVALTGVALVARLLLAPQLRDRIPLAPFFVAVVLAAFLAGPGPTATAAVLGYVVADWFFIEPLGALGPSSSTDLVRLIVYIVVCGIVLVGSTRISHERDRARASLVKLEREIAERKRFEEALRESEKALRLARHAAQIGTWNWNIATGVHDWSVRYKTLLGLRGNSPTGYEVFLRALHPDDRERIDRAVKDAIDHHTPYQVEMRVALPDGAVRWIASRGEAYYDDAGRPHQMAGIALDITAQKEAEVALRRSEEALREADRRKDEFLGVLAHELRNPLAPIRNSIHLLLRGDPASDQAARARAVIARQVEHLTRLVDDLLDVKRITTGKLRLHRTSMDLVQQVRETVEDLRPLFTSRGRSLVLNAPDEPMWMDGDRTRVAQLVSNLLHNAAKFTDSGGHVSVSVERGDGEARVRVRDDGVGVAPEMLDRMFEPFVQSDKTLHRTQAGLGLGLSLVRGIAELHGGAVRARSDGLGKGTEVVVTLPSSPPPSAPVASDVAPRPRHGAPRRVLVIEDNADAAESLRDVLEVLGGHQVYLAAEGETGIAAARQHRPDVILCDIGLPVMDGYEVARQLRADGIAPGARLVALSGYTSAGDVARALGAGFDDHVGKPPDIERVLEIVAEAPGGERPASWSEDITTGET
jgi:two-component system CheB/CheR fusion protein